MLLLLGFVTLISFFSTALLRRYALVHHVLDIPNERSAHTIPTPRGGGIAFVVAVLIAVPCIHALGFLTPQGSFALIFSGVFIATIGFLDDHGHLSIRFRILAHAVAAGLALYWMNGAPPIECAYFSIPANYFTTFLAFIYLIWFVNLYNFMDGIDGIASLQAILVCGSVAFLYAVCHDFGLMILPLVLMMSVLGFLVWNWPPAKIFMGDAGSGFLGFIFGVLSLQSAHMYPQFLWVWCILMGSFIVDASYTLLKRASLGEKIYLPHATHAYQKASRKFKSHFRVNLGILIIHFFWLFPLAGLVAIEKLDGLLGTILAYAPLIVLVVWLGAGKKSAPLNNNA